jgi:hypothetical protein
MLVIAVAVYTSALFLSLGDVDPVGLNAFCPQK